MRAVIYCRVSTTDQVQNLSLPTQEQGCREYCAKNDYDVERVFVDAGESAKTTDRPAFLELLTYCRQQKGRMHAVVVYSLTRFSRNAADHHAIAALLRGSGVMLRSVTEPIDESPVGRLMESILAGIAQFDNDVKAERTRVGMRAAIQRGRWCWQPPLGYRLGERRQAPSLIVDEGKAPIIREAFEFVANGKLTGRPLMVALAKRGLRGKGGEALGRTRLYKILRSPVYMGVVAGFGISAPGDFVPIVSEELFMRVQVRLDAKPARRGQRQHRNHPDFPLRRFIRCAACETPLTGGWTSGRSRRYAYYQCPAGCTRIPKAALEDAFLQLLDRVLPTPGYVRLLTKTIMFRLKVDAQGHAQRRAAATSHVRQLREKLDLLDKAFIFDKRLDDVSYRRQRDELREKVMLAEIDLHELEVVHRDTESTLAFAEHLLTHASALWTAAADVDARIAIQQKIFPEGIVWAPVRSPAGVSGFGEFVNARTCLHVYNLAAVDGNRKAVASPTRPTSNQIVDWLRFMATKQAA